MRKTFSITDQLVLDKLDKVENQSKYIQNLILKDIALNDDFNDYKETINETITKVLDDIKGIVDIMSK